MTRDILADAREFIGDRHERLQTHSEGCWRWHPACMVGLLAREVERLRTIMYRIVDEDCTVAVQGGTFYADGEPLFAITGTTQPRNGAVDTPDSHPTPGECRTP